jgi:alkanesulfonate monooxygenase SsuD/methylene tetrahydromethanopterin reductase-like flavin-dependent oxidoreductase (luciferase family)
VTTPVSLTVPQFATDPAPLLDLVRWAPSAGIAGLFAFDHLLPIGDARRPVLEGAATLGLMAAASPPQLRVGSLVLRVTLRPPPVTAAIAASLAALTTTPPVVGLGVGDRFSAEEGARFGMAPPGLDERLRLLTETIALVRERAPRALVWVGGTHPRVRQAAALADGWNGWGLGPEQLSIFREQLAADVPRLKVTWGGGVMLAASQNELRLLLERRRSTAGTNQPIAGTAAQVADELSRRAEVVDEVVVSVLPNRPATWELFAAEVLPQLG